MYADDCSGGSIKTKNRLEAADKSGGDSGESDISKVRRVRIRDAINVNVNVNRTYIACKTEA